MSSPRVVYTPHPNTAPAAEADRLSAIYRRAIQRYGESHKAAGTSGGEDARKEDANASGNVSISR
jgi:hypothetical protein